MIANDATYIHLCVRMVAEVYIPARNASYQSPDQKDEFKRAFYDYETFQASWRNLYNTFYTEVVDTIGEGFFEDEDLKKCFPCLDNSQDEWEKNKLKTLPEDQKMEIFRASLGTERRKLTEDEKRTYCNASRPNGISQSKEDVNFVEKSFGG